VAVDAAVGRGEKARRLGAFEHGGVVLVGRQHARRARLGGPPDHLEQRERLRLTVERKARVEDLVPAVLAVGLREHHQLDVGGVAPQRVERLLEVADLVRREGEPELLVRGGEPASIDRAQRPRLAVREQRLGLRLAREHALGHAVVQGGVERRGRIEAALERPAHPTLDPHHPVEPAGVRDVGRLARPRRDRAEPRHDPARVRPEGLLRAERAVREQPLQHDALLARERPPELHEVDETCAGSGEGRVRHAERREAPRQARGRQRGPTKVGPHGRAGRPIAAWGQAGRRT
jgi:hypothetical protein